MLWQLWYQATKDRRKRCLLYHPQLDRNNGSKSTGISPAITCRTLHSQQGYDNLHLADPRHRRNFSAAVTPGSLLPGTGTDWLGTIEVFHTGLAVGYPIARQKGRAINFRPKITIRDHKSGFRALTLPPGLTNSNVDLQARLPLNLFFCRLGLTNPVLRN
jgi:hypothetical protein